MGSGVSIVLFTRDLRVHDHPALTAAVRDSDEIVPTFVLDPWLIGRSPNRDRFLHASLADLDRSLVRLGGSLVIREGDPAEVCLELARDARAGALHVTSDVSKYAARREQRLRAILGSEGIELHLHPGNAVVEPGTVAPNDRDAYSVFTPYHRAWQGAPRREPLSPPERLRVPASIDTGRRPEPDAITPDSIDLPPGGESAARRHFDAYVAGDARRYGEIRNNMAADGTSRMSPYLRFGCVSANEVVQRLEGIPGAGELVRQVAWRDFFGQVLADDPSLEYRDMRTPPDDLPPVPGDAGTLLDRWAEGRTGLPLVDAGMRQLRREGWIHNRARLVVASFLTRRLGVPWQDGSKVFLRWLVDGDPANNSGGWQWVAGTGADPRRSRSFSPVRQAKRFDPNGTYIRRYVRELQDVSVPLIFAPWEEPSILNATGYPAPVLEVPAELRGSDSRAATGGANGTGRVGQARLQL